MKALRDRIKEQVEVPLPVLEAIEGAFQPMALHKGDYFLGAGNVCHQMAFIQKGYLRMFDRVEGKEITHWIGSNGKFVTAVSSFAFNRPSRWNIQAITDCELLVINRKDHYELTDQYKEWLLFDNYLLSISFAALEKKMFEHLHTTTQQRYEHLFHKNPSIFNEVPLQNIASMLGMSPETLSRLRNSHARRTS